VDRELGSCNTEIGKFINVGGQSKAKEEDMAFTPVINENQHKTF